MRRPGLPLSMLSDPGRNRVVVLALLGGEVVVGFIAMGIINGEEVALGPVRVPDAELVGATALSFPITGWVVAAWVCLPALAAYALTVPKEVRTAFGPLVQQRQPGYPPAPPGIPAAGLSARRAIRTRTRRPSRLRHPRRRGGRPTNSGLRRDAKGTTGL